MSCLLQDPSSAPACWPSRAATVWVAHSCPIVSAGVAAALSRLPGCNVRVCEGPGWPAADAAVLVGDVDALRVMVTRQAGEGGAEARPKVVVVDMGDDASEASPAMQREVSAWLALDCREEDLLAAVSGLIDTHRARPRAGLAPGALRRVREHIDAHLAERVEPAALAALAGLSECHFSRAFKQSLGMPPHRYLMARRVEAAAGLIRDSDRPLVDIALALGFSDQSHFTRLFTRLNGETPRDFRRRHRERAA